MRRAISPTAIVLLALSWAAPARADACPPGSGPRTCGYYELREGQAPWPGRPDRTCVVLDVSGHVRDDACVDPEQTRSGSARWPAGPDGVHHIPYWINPTQPWLPEERALAAIQAAIATWEAADPVIRFDYQGVTAAPPLPGDRTSVIGWLAGVDQPAQTFGPAADDAGRVEADVALSLSLPWGWFPCEQAEGSCFDIDPSSPTVSLTDVQNVVTHEVGLWFGLRSLSCCSGPDGARWLTMHEPTIYVDATGRAPTERIRDTLGLGDVLGLRARYPCDCPLPQIYEP